MSHAGLTLAQMLAERNVPRVFSVPGESFLAALDGLYELGVENIVCRHEGAVAMMADAMGKMTGQPGIGFVTRGPGATNASAGIHIAHQDSTPLVLFVGQIARDHRDREAFQEVDYRAMFGPLAKWVAEIDNADRLPEYVNRAFQVALSGRPGPVVLALPEDMLSGPCNAPPIARSSAATPELTAGQLEMLQTFLNGAQKPLMMVGGAGWSEQTAKDAQRFAEAFDLPLAVSFRRQDYVDNRSANYVGDLSVGGNPALTKRMREVDRLLVIGAKLSDIATNSFTAPEPGATGVKIAHIHADPDLPGTVFPTELAICASSRSALAQLATLRPANAVPWADWTKAARGDYAAWRTPQETPGAVKLEQVTTWLNDNLPDDAILTNGAGNYATFLNRYYQFRQFGTQLAPTSGSMGYGFPAAIAASLQHPDRTVVCYAGDGCIQMTINELSTAVQHGAKPIVIVANNGRYGTIRAHQERHYPGRISGTEMANPDYATLARAYGGHGETVTDDADFPAAFERAKASGKVAFIELRLDRDMLGTTSKISDFS